MKIADHTTAASAIPPMANDSQRHNTHHRYLPEKKEQNTGLKHSTSAVTGPSSDRILFNKLQGTNDQTLMVARQIRAVDKTLVQVEEKVREMRVFLEGVVKAYPPYPPGSNERVAALRQFAALRKQIDQLMVPPPDDSLGTETGETRRSEDSDIWQQLAGGNGPAQRLEGLNLPELSDDAADADLNHALKNLNNAYDRLQQTHKAFIDDANRIIAALQ